MMNPHFVSKVTLFLVFCGFLFINEANAQWSVGASYENRGEHPYNGFGLQLERDLSLPVPLLFVRTRAHYSYFNENNSVSLDGITYSQEFSSYDVGLAAMTGADIGLFGPYAGLGVGLENYTRDSGGEMDYLPQGNEWYYQAMVGLGLNVLPIIKPFVEFRYSGFSERQEIPDSPRRFVLGVALRF